MRFRAQIGRVSNNLVVLDVFEFSRPGPDGQKAGQVEDCRRIMRPMLLNYKRFIQPEADASGVGRNGRRPPHDRGIRACPDHPGAQTPPVA
jgi:hypothetical protein